MAKKTTVKEVNKEVNVADKEVDKKEYVVEEFDLGKAVINYLQRKDKVNTIDAEMLHKLVTLGSLEQIVALLATELRGICSTYNRLDKTNNDKVNEFWECHYTRLSLTKIIEIFTFINEEPWTVFKHLNTATDNVYNELNN